ncbi:unnamed protein product [Ceratitis capitata]|uniref:(Mediterranean fruit fly) hypothetical protein n=1 Tax=Ceratitis capitata TaxID=7213 RepID=A0A811V1Z0_CERCA|nr:unnamed protein product [Ceratitis capitata]
MKYFSAESSGISINPKVDDYSRNSPVAFSEQVTTVINFFEGWNHCERTVVLYALLKRLRYHNMKFLQHAIDHVLTQRLNSENNLSSVLIDLNANNPSYLKKLLNAYKTLHMNDAADALSSVSSDKESMQSFGSDFQITNCDEQKLYDKKKELLIEVLNMLPLLKPGNDEAKLVYLALIPATVRDTMQNRVPTELVQQIFSYLLIHPAISSEDRRSLNVWLRHLEDYMHANEKLSDPKLANNSSNLSQSIGVGSDASVSSVSSLTSTSSMSNNSMSSGSSAPGVGTKPQQKQRNVDWQTIAPPSKQYNPPPPNALPKLNPLPDWTNFIPKDTTFSNSGIKNITEVSLNSSGSSCNRRNSSITDQHCDNFNGINLNELGSSQNKLGLSLGIAKIGDATTEESSLVNGVAAVAGTSSGSKSQIDANTYNSNSNNSSSSNDEHDTSFSKNGTEIIDFEPQIRISVDAGCTNESSATSVNNEQNEKVIILTYV